MKIAFYARSLVPEHGIRTLTDLILVGTGSRDEELPEPIRHIVRVFTEDHGAISCSSRTVLNVSRDSMAANGCSPATRVFEAAGVTAGLISDAWEESSRPSNKDPNSWSRRDGAEVAEFVSGLGSARARRIGLNAMTCVIAGHTYAQRAGRSIAISEGSIQVGKPATA